VNNKLYRESTTVFPRPENILVIKLESTTLLLHYDIDIIFGNESHIDSTFHKLSSEILPSSYKDHSSRGGGVFIGYRQSYNLKIHPVKQKLFWAILQNF